MKDLVRDLEAWSMELARHCPEDCCERQHTAQGVSCCLFWVHLHIYICTIYRCEIINKSYSRANAPTGSAGEESVSWCWVVVVVVVVVVVDVDVDDVVVVVVVVVVVARCFVDTHARRARARQTRPQKRTHLARARARAARARTYAERRFGSSQTKLKPCYLRCFCSKRENKNWR